MENNTMKHENKDELPIKLPVRYDGVTECLIDADGTFIAIDIDGDAEHREATAGQIVTALNTRPAPAKIERDVAAEIADLNAKLDDADRRAGMAERLRAYDRDALNKNNDWRDRNKERLGFDRNISFDVVWQAVIDALGGYEKAKAILDNEAKDSPESA